MSLETLPSDLYKMFADVGKALSSPSRLQLLNLLCQREHSVQELADKTDQSHANTSAHLRRLNEADLVDVTKKGRSSCYRVASRRVIRLWLTLRDLGIAEIPKAREAMEKFGRDPVLEPDLSGEQLLERVKEGDVTVIDLRPEDEFEAGHIPGARSIPYAELDERMDEIPDDAELVAYCRGPYCVAAIKGSQKLSEHGFDVSRTPDGIAEWRAQRLPLEIQEATS
jgi:rhodanese-related sulfurtransferase/DNA-binding MarR family transcriptional regulator